MSEPVFQYRLSNNGWRTLFGLLISWGLTIFIAFAVEQNWDDIGLWVLFFAMLGIAGFISLYTIVSFMFPDATELVVNNDSLSWRTPWPLKKSVLFDLSDIAKINYAVKSSEEPDLIYIKRLEGAVVKIPGHCFNGDAVPVIRAIRQVAPHIQIEEQQTKFWPRKIM